jgi:hypothetical protein
VSSNARRLSFVERALLRAYQRDYVAYMDRLARVADFPLSQRTKEFNAARTKLTRSLNPFSRVASPDFDAFARQRDRSVAALDLLIEATRVDLERVQEWPAPADPDQFVITLLSEKHVRVAAKHADEELAVEMTADDVPLEARGL